MCVDSCWKIELMVFFVFGYLQYLTTHHLFRPLDLFSLEKLEFQKLKRHIKTAMLEVTVH